MAMPSLRLRPELNESEPREYRCPKCGAFVMKASAPWGWTHVYCRWCKAWRTVYMGKKPVLTPATP